MSNFFFFSTVLNSLFNQSFLLSRLRKRRTTNVNINKVVTNILSFFSTDMIEIKIHISKYFFQNFISLFSHNISRKTNVMIADIEIQIDVAMTLSLQNWCYEIFQV